MWGYRTGKWEVQLVINCNIKGEDIRFDENDVNNTFELKDVAFNVEAINEEMVKFLEFIKYNAEHIDMSKLNKNYVRREWLFLFDAL